MGGTEVSHFEPEGFEALAADNGFRYWLASDLMHSLNYRSMAPVLRAVQRAISASVSINAPIQENFSEIKTPGLGLDWRLSRFACYLTIMNCDPKNPLVARAQIYFVRIAESIRNYVEEARQVDRVVIRSELAEREKTLHGTAKDHGVQDYALFQNAGYRGLYNMNLSQLRHRKGIPPARTPLDYMGKTELAANLFRITQTEEKIKNEEIRGQGRLERAAESVGRKVRSTMIDISGSTPEELPADDDIKRVRREIKRVGKGLAKLDKQR